MKTCKKGYKGDCCCLCKHRLPIFCHPWNKEVGKGSILKQFGWVCMEPERTHSIFFDLEHSHGMCELFERKEKCAKL